MAILAFGTVFLIAALLALLGSITKSKQQTGIIEGYLLAGGSLGRTSIVSLLMSGCFGLNSMLYQVWLGYSVGLWGLLIQGAWALSFAWLAKYSSVIRRHRSLHELLGSHYGATTRLVAGLFSVLGITYLIGWEASIGVSTFRGILELNPAGAFNVDSAALWLTGCIVGGCLLYTILGGLRGNALVDLFQNGAKILGFILLGILLLLWHRSQTGASVWDALFPSLDRMVANLGWWGLVTNIAFSLAWQFVDTSTWQSIIAGVRSSESDTKWNLRIGGIAVFVAPGIIGTVLGAFMINAQNIDPGNILTIALSAIHHHGDFLTFLVLVTLIACIMSMVDGLFLAAAYALIVDVFHPKITLGELDSNPSRAERTLLFARLALVGVALAGFYGIPLLMRLFQADLFQFVYIVIITQLSLIGVIAAAFSKRIVRYPPWLAIVGAAVIGFGSAIWGTRQQLQPLIDSAGTITIVSSLLFAWICTQKSTTDTMKSL